MDDIQIFKNEVFGEVRVAGTGEEPLFCLADICRILDLHTGMTKQRLDAKGISLIDTPTNGGVQQLIYISEKNLYKTIMRSDKPQAEPFQDWVCGEVLPSIRKHGGYLTPDKIEEVLSNPDTIIRLAMQLKDEQSKRRDAEQHIAILTHTNKTYTATEVAKEIGMRSAAELSRWLESEKVQYKVNGTWVPCAGYANLAWFEIKQEELDNGRIIYHRKITGIGRDGIINLYQKGG
jgi:prophage antirepressor-like protein